MRYKHGSSGAQSASLPGAVIEPVVELIEAVLDKVARGAEVEPRVEFVDHRLVAQHAKKAASERDGKDNKKDEHFANDERAPSRLDELCVARQR